MKNFSYYILCFLLFVSCNNENKTSIKKIDKKDESLKNLNENFKSLKSNTFYKNHTGDMLFTVKKDSNNIIGEVFNIKKNIIELNFNFKRGKDFYYVYELSKERVEVLNVLVFDTLFNSKYLMIIEPFPFPKQQNIYCMKYQNDSLYFLDVYTQDSLNFDFIRSNFMHEEVINSMVNHIEDLKINNDIVVEQNVKGSHFYKLSWVNIFMSWYFVSYKSKNGEKAFSNLQEYRLNR